MEITLSAFKPVSDLIESNKREQMSPVARLIDLILSFIGLRPTSSENSESLARELAMPLYRAIMDGSEASIALMGGITLSVDPSQKTAILSSPYGTETYIPYHILITACLNLHPLNLHPLNIQTEEFISPTLISYQKASPEEEIEQFLKDQPRGFNNRTTVDYCAENSREPQHLNGDSLSILANALADRKEKQGAYFTEGNVSSLPFQYMDEICCLDDTDIYRIASVCNQGFISAVTNNVVIGIRNASKTVHVMDNITAQSIFDAANIPDVFTAQLMSRTSLPREALVSHTLRGDDITSTWSDVGLPVFDLVRREWEYMKCDVTLSHFRGGKAWMSVNFNPLAGEHMKNTFAQSILPSLINDKAPFRLPTEINMLYPCVGDASLEKINRIIVFGDSLSDSDGRMLKKSHHLLPSRNQYYEGRFTNGFVWSEFLSSPSFLDKKTINFAEGGSTSASYSCFNITGDFLSDLDKQIKLYSPSDKDLAICILGANDYLTLHKNNILKVVEKQADQLERILYHNVGNVLVLGLPDLSDTPYASQHHNKGLMKDITIAHNALLKSKVEALQCLYSEQKISYFDTYSAFETIRKIARKIGYDTTHPFNEHGYIHIPGEQDPVINIDPEYIYNDMVHPTQEVHQCFATILGNFIINNFN